MSDSATMPSLVTRYWKVAVLPIARYGPVGALLSVPLVSLTRSIDATTPPSPGLKMPASAVLSVSPASSL